MNVKVIQQIMWALMRFVSEPLRNPIGAHAWKSAVGSKTLDKYLEAIKAPYHEEDLLSDELDEARRRDEGYQRDSIEFLEPGLRLTEIRDRLFENSYPRAKAKPVFAEALEGGLADWLDLSSLEMEERCVSVLVARQAEADFELNEVRDALGLKTGLKNQTEIIARMYTDTINPAGVAVDHLKYNVAAVIEEDKRVGSTARSLWLPVAHDLLEDQGLYYLSFVGAPASPPISMVLSRSRMPGMSWRVPLLSMTAVALSVRYDWDLSQATTFVLTGRVPMAQSVGFRMIEEGGGPMPRFEMNVGASVSPAELAKAYISARDRRLKGFKGIGKKHAALATFASGFDNEGQEDWRATMEAWNVWASRHLATDQKAAYTNLALFKRDVQQARARLLRLGDE